MAPALKTSEWPRIALSLVQPSPYNPRRHFDEQQIAQLAESVAEDGVLQPIVVRPIADGRFEIVAGERRYRAAIKAGLSDIPYVVKELTDRKALEIALIENNQRVDVHPLDEAAGFDQLRKIDPSYDLKTIAKRIKRSEAYVRDRLQLLKLHPIVQEAFEAGAIGNGHAGLIAGAALDLQPKALERCFGEDLLADLPKDIERTPDQDDLDDIALLIAHRRWDVLTAWQTPMAELEDWLKHRKIVDIRGDEEVRQGILKDLGEPAQPVDDQAPDPVKSLLQLSTAQWLDHVLHESGVVPANGWKLIKGKNKCEYAAKGVVVHGDKKPGAIKVLDVCASQACKIHFPPAAKPRPSSNNDEHKRYLEQQRKLQEKAEAERKAWEGNRKQLAAAFVQHLGSQKVLTVNAAFVRHLLRNPYELSRANRVETDFEIELTDKNAVTVLALSTVSVANRHAFVASTKAFKFDVAAAEKAVKAEAAKNTPKKPAAAKKAPAKSATKKAAPKKTAAKKGKKR